MEGNCEQLYRDKRVTPAEAIASIGNAGASVRQLILGMGLAMPPALVKALGEAALEGSVGPLDLYYMHGTQELEEMLLQTGVQEAIKPRPLFLSAHDRAVLHAPGLEGWMEYVPSTFHQVGRLLTEQIEPECFMVTVSGMDKHGYFSLGTNADYGASVVRKAKKVVVEVNRNMPRTFGECLLHVSDVDLIVENDTPLGEVITKPPTDNDIKIAESIASLIEDGDTLQMGIGGVPNAVLGMLKNHHDLGLHSELFSPAMVDLIEAGALNGRKKSWMQHKHVYTLALGDKAMFDFMDDNPSIVGYPASWVNNPGIIRKNRNMVSVNAAIEVDLSGQINAEQMAGGMHSGTGGQLDFVRGAYAAPNGRSFVALPATAKQGGVSRIVAQLQGGAVTDTRMDTQYVVTEFGCANLKGLSLRERAQALIGLADPAFREQLERDVHESGLFKRL